MKNLEIEFKWDANVPGSFARITEAARKLGAQLGAVKELQIYDEYVDTPSRDFEKQQIAMRLRQVGSSWEATFKTRTEIINGKAVRQEETYALPHIKNKREALHVLQQQKTWNGLNVSDLCPLFTLHNKRKIQLVTFQHMQAELAMDACRLIVCGRRVFFKEIELELKKGSADTFEKFASELTERAKLTLARVSKVKTAVSLLRLWEEKK